MKYLLLKVIDKNVYEEFYSSNDLEYLIKMRDILFEKYKIYYFIVEVK